MKRYEKPHMLLLVQPPIDLIETETTHRVYIVTYWYVVHRQRVSIGES